MCGQNLNVGSQCTVSICLLNAGGSVETNDLGQRILLSALHISDLVSRKFEYHQIRLFIANAKRRQYILNKINDLTHHCITLIVFLLSTYLNGTFKDDACSTCNFDNTSKTSTKSCNDFLRTMRWYNNVISSARKACDCVVTKTT